MKGLLFAVAVLASLQPRMARAQHIELTCEMHKAYSGAGLDRLSSKESNGHSWRVIRVDGSYEVQMRTANGEWAMSVGPYFLVEPDGFMVFSHTPKVPLLDHMSIFTIHLETGVASMVTHQRYYSSGPYFVPRGTETYEAAVISGKCFRKTEKDSSEDRVE
ncbi:hypothetical protein [Salipiger bermudensis]|uniref:hypothetical protein n=1 Tax=Salipiger bermudensis TaxID=344736 RepID=UPI0011853500|nr:hypothetical protein [Salipiger bermudensis]